MWGVIKTGTCIAFFGLVFLLSGLVINLIQFIIYVTLYKFNRDLYRRINYYLIYSSWSQVVAVTEWWSGTTCRMIGDEESLKNFGNEHSLIIMNHKYDVDWLMCWLMCDKLKMLGSAKTFSKRSLRKVPVIGWGWVFAEMIFLERNWERDSLVMGQKLDELMKYKDKVMILLFCEGTRFTKEKHKASMEYARQKNLPELKYHLLPRTKGFNYCIQHLKNKMKAIYDVEIGISENPKPTMLNILLGHKLIGDMYIRRIPMQDIPMDSDEECSKWLHDLYQEKDKHMEEYLKSGRFPGKYVEFSRRPYPALNFILWSLLVGTPFIYGVWMMLFSGNTIVVIAGWTTLALVLTAVYLFIRVTKADKGSAYGKASHISSMDKIDNVAKTKTADVTSIMETIPESTEEQLQAASTEETIAESAERNGSSVPNGHLIH